MSGGGATWHENALVPITRNGKREDVYWTYSYGPIDDESAPNGVGGVLVVCTETTATVLAEKRQADEAQNQRWLLARLATLAELAERIRELDDPDQLAYAAAEILGRHLAVSRAGYGTINKAAETITIERDWNAPGIKSLAGTLHFRDYGSYIEDLKRGDTVVVADANEDPRTAATASALIGISARSLINMPVTEQGGFVALLYLNHAEARQWTKNEIDLVREVAERTRMASERRRVERALRESESRLRFLDELTQETADSRDGDSMLATTTRMLAEHLSVDVCAYADMEPDQDRFTIRGNWHSSSATSIVGTYSLQSFGERAVTNLRAGRPLVVNDNIAELGLEQSAAFLALGIRATICIPFLKEGRLTALMAVHTAAPHRWSDEELAIVSEVVGRSWAHIERVRAETALVEADRRKDEFIATLAHELRNPLAPIRNASRVAKSPSATEAQRRWSNDVIERQVNQMALLLDDLLDVSRITRGTLRLKREPVELAAIFDTAIETARPLIDARGHELIVQLPEEPIWLEADALRLAQVLSNLLTNSAKYSENKGSIRLEAQRENAEIVVRVIDSGIGIDGQQLPNIFEMFAQGQPAIDRAEGGLGIGLALVKGLVSLHGGSIDAASEGVGKGSTFTVKLPAATHLDARDGGHSLEGAMPAQAASRRILVVDDNRDSAESMAMLLQLEGHEVRVVHDGETALQSADAFRPDVVLLDIGMPQMNGYEVARRLRASQGARQMTLIAVTGWGQAEDKRRASEAGFDRHLVKPIAHEDLAKLIGK